MNQPAVRAGESERRMVDERLDLLATALFCVAGLVLALSLIGAVMIASSSESLGLLSPDVERQGRGLAAIATLGSGFAAAGVLAGLAGILKALLRRDAR